MEEIIESVYYEIKSSGFEKKLIAGIVITGGGSQLKHVTQLVEYITGMDTRIGYPNEHLGKGMDEVKSPMYATGVGLVIKGLQDLERDRKRPPSATVQPTVKGESRKRWWQNIFSNEFLGDDKDNLL